MHDSSTGCHCGLRCAAIHDSEQATHLQRRQAPHIHNVKGKHNTLGANLRTGKYGQSFASYSISPLGVQDEYAAMAGANAFTMLSLSAVAWGTRSACMRPWSGQRAKIELVEGKARTGKSLIRALPKAARLLCALCRSWRMIASISVTGSASCNQRAT
jgi:hypothetical protein